MNGGGVNSIMNSGSNGTTSGAGVATTGGSARAPGVSRGYAVFFCCIKRVRCQGKRRTDFICSLLVIGVRIVEGIVVMCV